MNEHDVIVRAPVVGQMPSYRKTTLVADLRMSGMVALMMRNGPVNDE